LESDGGGQRLALAEEDERGGAHQPKVEGDVLVLVARQDVQGSEFCFVLVFLGDLAEDGREPDAPRALLMPEVDDDQAFGFEDFRFPAVRVDFYNAAQPFSPRCIIE